MTVLFYYTDETLKENPKIIYTIEGHQKKVDSSHYCCGIRCYYVFVNVIVILF